MERYFQGRNGTEREGTRGGTERKALKSRCGLCITSGHYDQISTKIR
jgi:hypothetical protein